MGAPSYQLPAGYAETLIEIREALESRVTNATRRLSATPSFHRGAPTPDQLPDDELGVWLDWTAVDPDEDEGNKATFVASSWSIFICTREDGNDAFGQGSDLGIILWGDILKTLTETNADLGLDGACDLIPVPSARHGHSGTAGGNKRVDVIEMQLLVRHQAEICRQD